MTRTPTEVATAAAERFRVLRERAAGKLARARSDAAALRARVRRESTEMMARARRREDELVSPWPDEPKVARYQFDDAPDDTTDHPAPTPGREDDDDNMSNVDTWLR